MNDDILTGLNSIAASVAQAYLASFPGDTLTSGRRSIADQAAAMASNVIQNSQWIAQTYISTPISQACQAVVDGLTEPMTQASIAAALEDTLASADASTLRQLSWHLAGDAFDVQPVDDPGGIRVGTLEKLISDRISAGGQGKLLTKEGGLIRWHVQVA